MAPSPRPHAQSGSVQLYACRFLRRRRLSSAFQSISGGLNTRTKLRMEEVDQVPSILLRELPRKWRHEIAKPVRYHQEEEFVRMIGNMLPKIGRWNLQRWRQRAVPIAVYPVALRAVVCKQGAADGNRIGRGCDRIAGSRIAPEQARP